MAAEARANAEYRAWKRAATAQSGRRYVRIEVILGAADQLIVDRSNAQLRQSSETVGGGCGRRLGGVKIDLEPPG